MNSLLKLTFQCATTVRMMLFSVVVLLSSQAQADVLNIGGHKGNINTIYYGSRDVSGQMLVVTDGESARFMFEQLGAKLGFEDLGRDGATLVTRTVADNVACFQTSGPVQPGSSLYIVRYFCLSQLNPATGEMIPELYWNYHKIIPNGISIGN